LQNLQQLNARGSATPPVDKDFDQAIRDVKHSPGRLLLAGAIATTARSLV
jgi:hypothetical protein